MNGVWCLDTNTCEVKEMVVVMYYGISLKWKREQSK